jgi:probable HAF family extracellular repeat protein
MTTPRFSALVLMVLLGTGVPASAEARSPKKFTIVELNVPGICDAFPASINNRGEVVGIAEDPPDFCDDTTAVLWRNGVIVNLGPHVAQDINDRGQVIGFLDLAALTGFFWDDGVRTELTLGGDSRANAINERGQVVGTSQLLPFTGPFHAFLFQDGSIVDLGVLPGHNASSANDINEHEQIVGSSWSESAADEVVVERAALWEDGVIVDLGSLGGDFSEAIGINNRGQIIGTSMTAAGHQRAFLWQDGLMTDLGTLGGNVSTAIAINRRGQVIGTSTTADGQTHGFLWDDGFMRDLGTFIPRKINRRGQLIGDVGSRQLFFWQDGVLTDLSPNTPSGFASDINDKGAIAGSVGDTPVVWIPLDDHRRHHRHGRKHHHRWHHDHDDHDDFDRHDRLDRWLRHRR